ncbi:NUDIX domain-containing protein [Patescibacteria group bacterium]|nr:NUDIX domain-containing protein [Patescibacteria group bacterium]
MARVFSAGGVVFKKEKSSRLVWLVAKHAGYHKWILPKGKIEKGEKSLETALREVKEETGVVAKPVSQKTIFKLEYFFWGEKERGGKKTKIFKTVFFYLLQYISGSIESHDLEMEQVVWLSSRQALEKLAFKGEKEALKEGMKLVGKS